jgi:hypothetical protein
MPDKRRKNGFRGPTPDVGKATQFKPGNKGGPGRPKTKILREIAREIIEETDPKRKKIRARVLLDALIKRAQEGSLGHFQQLLQLLEADASGINWPGSTIQSDTGTTVKDFTKEELTAILRARTGK